jgi:hypothetical protein
MRHGPVNPARGPFFGPVRARPGPCGMGPGWHDPVEQAVPGPLARHVGRHGTTCSVRTARSGPIADAVASLTSSAPRPLGPTSQPLALAFAPARSLLRLSLDSAAIDLANPLCRGAAPIQRPRLPSPTPVTSIHQLLSNPNPSPLSNPLSLGELCEFVLSSRPPLRPSHARRRL